MATIAVAVSLAIFIFCELWFLEECMYIILMMYWCVEWGGGEAGGGVAIVWTTIQTVQNPPNQFSVLCDLRLQMSIIRRTGTDCPSIGLSIRNTFFLPLSFCHFHHLCLFTIYLFHGLIILLVFWKHWRNDKLLLLFAGTQPGRNDSSGRSTIPPSRGSR